MASPEQYSATLRQAVTRAHAEIRRGLLAAALDAETRARALARERMRVRTGQLVRSIRGEVTGPPEAPELRLSAGRAVPLRYAAMQEYGGTVRPKRGRWLAIPTGAALTASGVPRYETARQVPGLRFVSIDGARALLVRDVGGRRGRSEILYYLRRKVQIRPKSYMQDAFDAATHGLREQLQDRVAALLRVTRGQ